MSGSEDWPILQVPAVQWTDDDAEFYGDIKYMRQLVDAIIDTVLDQRFGR
jgi:hypothetical protein